LRRIDIDDEQIENNLVKNQFIINQGIEQTVLIRDSDEGARFMKDRGLLSANVKMCFTFSNGDKRRGRVINYTGAGGINNSPIDEYRGQLRMQVDKEAQIRYVVVLQNMDIADHVKTRRAATRGRPASNA
jgi:ADP-glucose pyrophosphorylase